MLFKNQEDVCLGPFAMLARPGEVLLRKRTLGTGRCLHRRVNDGQPQLYFSDSSKESLDCETYLWVEVTAEEIHDEWIEGLYVFVEAFPREVGITFHNIDNNRSPRHDISLMRLFLELRITTNDIRTQPRRD